MERLKDILHRENCSLVVEKNGEVSIYRKRGVRDLIWLLDNDRATLENARVADKVVGKAAAGLMVQGKVREVYADVMSRKALPVLQAADIALSYGILVDNIIIPAGDNRCPLEKIVGEVHTAQEIETTLRRHFAEMQAKRQDSAENNNTAFT